MFVNLEDRAAEVTNEDLRLMPGNLSTVETAEIIEPQTTKLRQHIEQKLEQFKRKFRVTSAHANRNRSIRQRRTC